MTHYQYIIYTDFREAKCGEMHILEAKKYSNCLIWYIFFPLFLVLEAIIYRSLA